MNGRDSRVSMGARQNDALFEFESFKKKFLLANKHITKLNSTLSVRIEELNAQISTLYVENLRLRASEIALSAQLKKEREKSRKIIAEAETATASLSKHLVFLRRTFDIGSTSPLPPSPPPPKVRRPVIKSVASPNLPRLSRPPAFPGIFEEDECSSENDDPKNEPRNPKPASPSRRKIKAKPRLSASRLPLPARASSPSDSKLHSPAVTSLGMEVALSGGGVSVKKPSRRQTSLLSASINAVQQPRPPSPAFGSPILGSATLGDDGEMVDGKSDADLDCRTEDVEREEPEKFIKRDKRKGKGKEREQEKEWESLIDVPRRRERDRKRGRDEDIFDNRTVADNKLKLKDVTNSPRSQSALPLDTGAGDRGRHQSADPDMNDIGTGVHSGTQAFSSPSTTSNPPTQLPTPRASSSPPPIPLPETEANTRERRARKSVNYAEPKLNTKMRKPCPPTGTSSNTRKRSSGATFSNIHTLPHSEEDVDEPAPRSSLEHDATPKPVKLASSNAFPPPIPTLPPNSSTAHPPSSTTRISSATTVKRKKSRPYIVPSDDESDGAQADVDADFGDIRRTGSGWLNVERRRKSVNTPSTSRAVDVGEDMNSQIAVEPKEGRRHSVAV